MQLPDLLKSKKFQAAIVALIATLVVEAVPSMRDVPLEAVLAPFIAFILGQGVADFGKSKAKIEKGDE